ncbi:hypothetical protein M758_5G109100 [Ceratodon purpureus]|nr:hypothetical protein M758_5G109100 [Ceratodon purpureus]
MAILPMAAKLLLLTLHSGFLERGIATTHQESKRATTVTIPVLNPLCSSCNLARNSQ